MMRAHPALRGWHEVQEQLRLNKIYQGLRVEKEPRPKYVFNNFNRDELEKLGRKTKTVFVPGVVELYLPICGGSPASYFVKNGGNDENLGTSDEEAWATITKVNATELIAGDEVRFKCDSSWTNPSLHAYYGGSEGSPVKYTKYGEGALPLFVGSAPSPWVAITDYGASTQSYITIEYIEIKDYDDEAADGRGMDFRYTSHLIIRYCNLHDNVMYGFIAKNCDYSEFYGSEIYDNEDNGMWLQDADYLDVYDNIVHGCGSNGIGARTVTYSDFHHNTCYANSDPGASTAGIGLEVEAANNNIYYNLLYDDLHAGVVLNASNNKVYNNTFYNNGTAAGGCQLNLIDWVSSAPENNIIKNNIFCFPSGNARGVYLLDAGDVAWTGLNNTFDYNLYCVEGGPDQDPMVTDTTQEPEVDYTFATWVSSAGMEANGQCIDPKFMDAANDDYHLKSNSPCIDSGVDVGLTHDRDYIPVGRGVAPDQGCYETLKGGPRRL